MVGLGLIFSFTQEHLHLPATRPQALSTSLSLTLGWGGTLFLDRCRGDWQAGPLKQREAGTGHPEAAQRRQQPHPPSLGHGLTPQVSTSWLPGVGGWGPAGSECC